MPLPDHRFVELSRWLESLLGSQIEISLISGDASFRRYFRISNVCHAAHKAQQLIAVDSPPDLVPIEPFINLSNYYAGSGLNVPEVIAFNMSSGFMLQTDLGNEQLLHRLNNDTVETLYTQALSQLPQVASVKANNQPLPPFDSEFILKELTIFDDWLLSAHLKHSTSQTEQLMLKNVYFKLVENCLEQPQVTMHRDYHSRNIMLCGDDMYLIDYQDSVTGPITYDAVSLLRDCYVVWPEQKVQSLAHTHFQLCKQNKLLTHDISFQHYQKWFDLTGMQRHIKIAGIFARLHHRDKKSGYLKDIPQSLKYVIEVANRYSEYKEFADWIEQQILPLVLKQDLPSERTS
ncbi:MAG: aminoglycoside phosphotransferase family protein [Parashewanella sp.]